MEVSDAYSGLGDFDDRGDFNSATGAGPDVRWGLSGLPAVGPFLRWHLHVAASVQRVGIGRRTAQCIINPFFASAQMPAGYWQHRRAYSRAYLAALDQRRRLCNNAAEVMPFARVPGSLILIEAIKSAIDDYAEHEMEQREYVWGRPAAQRRMQAFMRKAMIMPSDTAWCYSVKRGKYRRRTDVRIGKPVKGKRRR